MIVRPMPITAKYSELLSKNKQTKYISPVATKLPTAIASDDDNALPLPKEPNAAPDHTPVIGKGIIIKKAKLTNPLIPLLNLLSIYFVILPALCRFFNALHIGLRIKNIASPTSVEPK